jgi:hypothetical protein
MAARGSVVAAVWSASTDTDADIYIATSRDGGASFGAPRRVNDVAGDSGASGEQPPRVAIGPDALHVIWPAKRGRHAISYARSTDGGLTFSNATDIPSAGLRGARGWATLGVDDDGTVHMLWLDGRASVKPEATAGAPMHHHDPRQDIYHATWRQAGGITEKRVAENVCFCCKTALALSRGRVHAAWRQIYPGSIRDIAFARTAAGAGTFTPSTRVSADNWELDGCPDDGPSVAVDEAGSTRIVWPTLVPGPTPRKGIFYAASNDGASFTPRLQLDSGEADPAHPQIAMTSGGTSVAVWDEIADGSRRIVLRRVDNAGRPGSQEILSADAGGIYPAVVAVPDGFVVAWTKQARGDATRQIQVKKLK